MFVLLLLVTIFKVAVKIAKQEDEYCSLQNEAQVLQHLGKAGVRGVASMLSFADEGAFHVLISEYVEGMTLAKAICTFTFYPWSNDLLDGQSISCRFLINLAAQLLAVMQAVHQAGVCHLDIKPQVCFLFLLLLSYI